MKSIHTEAIGAMPPERKFEVFNGAPFADCNQQGIVNEHASCPDSYVREMQHLAGAFEVGGDIKNNGGKVWGNWTTQARGHESTIQMWCGQIRETRAKIAQQAGIDDLGVFEATINEWWKNYGNAQSIIAPNILDFEQMDFEVAMTVAFKNYPIEAAIGFGGTNDPSNDSRGYGYVVPALDFIQSFANLGIRVPLRVFFAHELSASVNPLEVELAREISQKTGDNIEGFAGEFYPKVSDAVSIETPTLESVESFLDHLGATSSASQIFNQLGGMSDKSRKFFTRIVDLGKRKGSNPSASARYILGHVAPDIFGTYVNTARGPISTIKIGGPSESAITVLQREVARLIQLPDSSKYARVHSRTRVSGDPYPYQVFFQGRNNDIPPYYDDPRANSVQIDARSVTFREKEELDSNTALAAARAGGLDQLIDFMRSTIPKVGVS